MIISISNAYSRWIQEFDWNIALTLNFDSGVHREKAEEAARHYWNQVDKALFGKIAVRKRKIRLPRACFLEGEEGVRNWHFHCVVQMPKAELLDVGSQVRCVSDTEFCEWLLEEWKKIDEAGKFSKAEPLQFARRWVQYISKCSFKEDESFCPTTSPLPINDALRN